LNTTDQSIPVNFTLLFFLATMAKPYNSFAMIDDKFVPLARVMWVANTPHFCGDEECEREGQYEVGLENGESLWGNLPDRDTLLEKLDRWANDPGFSDESEE
jgi:hypothetical protein